MWANVRKNLFPLQPFISGLSSLNVGSMDYVLTMVRPRFPDQGCECRYKIIICSYCLILYCVIICLPLRQSITPFRYSNNSPSRMVHTIYLPMSKQSQISDKSLEVTYSWVWLSLMCPYCHEPGKRSLK